MAPRPKQTPAQARDARAKKILLLLAPILVVVVAIQAPRLLSSSSEAEGTATDTTASVDAQSVVPDAAPAESAPEGTTGTDAAPGEVDPTAEALATSAVAPAEGLEDTDSPPQASEGQLVVFTRFVATDPFVQLVDDTSENVEEGETTVTTSSVSTEPASPGPSSSPTVTTSIPPPSGTTTGTITDSDGGSTSTEVEVEIKVNSKLVVVGVGDTFPASDPAFELVAVEGGVAKIGLVGGSFSSGIETLDLRKGDSVTLISQPDGARFTLEIVSIG